MEPVALLVHVPDVEAGTEWYRQAFPSCRVSRPAQNGLAILNVDGFDLEIVQADDKVSSGKSGVVLYWSVESVEEALQRLIAIGATLYRGPMPIEYGLAMCQVEDPFGNLIGIRGGMSRSEH